MVEFAAVNNVNGIACNYIDRNKYVTESGQLSTANDKRPHFKLLAKHQCPLSLGERFGRVLAGLLVAIFSLGLAFIDKNMRKLFTRKFQVQRYGIDSPLNQESFVKPNKEITIASAQASAMPQSVSMQSLPVKERNFPYCGQKKSKEWEMPSKKAIGTYAVHTCKMSQDIFVKVKAEYFFFGQKIVDDKSYTLMPDPEKIGAFIVSSEDSTTTEKFASVEDFIESKLQSGEFLEPLETNYDIKAARDQEIRELATWGNIPYVKNITHWEGLHIIKACEIGAFIIRDSANGTDKVVVFKDNNDEVQELRIVPASGLLGGYYFDGKWYACIRDCIQINHTKFKKNFHFTWEQFENHLTQLAKEKKAIQSQDIEVHWLTEHFQAYRKRVEKGEPLNTLMSEALDAKDILVAKWLLQKGAELTSLPGNEVFDWLHKYATRPAATPETLNDYALNIGYGYKSANLFVQKNSVQELNEQLTFARVEVPDFLPFSDFEIRHHLAPIMLEIEELWNKFLKEFKLPDPSLGQTDFLLESLHISQQGKQFIEQIQEKITSYFARYPFDSPEIQDWLEKLGSDYLIVRSTGKEDTEDNPNPGGNETIAYVRPEAAAVSQAISQVIASYFSTKSIAQRLLNEDSSIFSEKPFLPVLLMKMVTEKVNGADHTSEIPRSGVMFTRQKGKAEGVTLIQTGLGNNEGIVASKVAVDTYYVDQHYEIASVIKEKKTRLVPAQKGEGASVHLETVSSPDAQTAKAPALSNATIKDMKRIADFFAKKYARQGIPAAMDMEYTIQPQGLASSQPVINLLQIRPLREKQGLVPTYLDLDPLNNLPRDKKVSIKTLLAGESRVLDIAHSSDIMFVDNLTQGLMRYLFRKQETHGVKEALPRVIFSRKTAPLTSHEALFFKNRGVVVYVVEDDIKLIAIKKLLAEADQENPIKADPQRGLIISTKDLIEHAKMVNDGYISYPIPCEISLPRGMFTPCSGGISPQELKVKIALLNTLYQKLDGELRQNQAYLSDKSLRELFDLVAISNDQAQAKIALATLLKRMHDDLIKIIKQGQSAQLDTVHLLLQTFDAAVTLSTKQVLPAFEKAPGTPDRLYPLRFLEALLFQTNQSSVVSCESWQTVSSVATAQANMSVLAKKEKLAEISGNTLTWQTQLQLLATKSFNSEIRKDWLAFLNGLAVKGTPEERSQVNKMIVEISRLGLISSWLNLIFGPIWKSTALSSKRSTETLAKLAEMLKKDRQMLLWIQNKNDQLAILKDNVSAWSSPEHVSKSIMSLRHVYLNDFGFNYPIKQPLLKQLYQRSNSLGRLAFLEFMRQSIDVYDQTIKNVTGSSEYDCDKQQQIKDVASLLVTYLDMLRGICKIIPKNERPSLIEGAQLHKIKDLINLLKYGRLFNKAHLLQDNRNPNPLQREGLEGILWALINGVHQDPAILQTRDSFNGAAVTLGANVTLKYGVVLPETLEEIFTTIHQNLEKVRKFLTNKECNLNKLFEGDMQDFHALTKSCLGALGFNGAISHFNIQGRLLEVTYQIPLREHACSLSYEWNISHPEEGITVKVATFGGEEHNRFAQTASYGALLGNLGVATQPKGSLPEINYKNPSGCAFSFHFPTNSDNRDKEKWLKTINYLMRDLSIDRFANVFSVIEHMEKFLPNGEWGQINKAFFDQIPYLSNTLMQIFKYKGNFDLLYRTCQGTFASLIAYGLSDYTLSEYVHRSVPDYFNINLLNNYYKAKEYDYVPGNSQEDKNNFDSTLLRATLFLIQGLHEQRTKAEPVVEEIIANAEIASKFPDTVVALRRALNDVRAI